MAAAPRTSDKHHALKHPDRYVAGRRCRRAGLKGRHAGAAAIPIVFIRSVHHSQARNSQ